MILIYLSTGLRFTKFSKYLNSNSNIFGLVEEKQRRKRYFNKKKRLQEKLTKDPGAFLDILRHRDLEKNAIAIEEGDNLETFINHHQQELNQLQIRGGGDSSRTTEEISSENNTYNNIPDYDEDDNQSLSNLSREVFQRIPPMSSPQASPGSKFVLLKYL